VQAAIVTALARDLQRAWPQLNVSELRATLPRFTTLVAALVHRYGSASATAAVQQYRTERASAGVTGRLTLIPAQLPRLPQIGQTVDWATQPLWAAEPDIAAAEKLVQSSAEKLVLDVGRDTIVSNARRDDKARGWARVPEPGACYFCALLATRGMVYKKATAGFLSHDHCRCHAEPVFTAYEPSAQIREWQQLYRDSTHGSGSKNVQRQWRKAYAAAYPDSVA